MEDTLLLEGAILVVLLVLVRIFYLVHKITTGHSKYATTKRKKPAKTVICIGSGGHTREMLTLLQSMDLNKYTPRYYIVASTDKTSDKLIKGFEQKNEVPEHAKVINIPRSREVGQSYLSSVFTTLYSIFYSIPVILYIRPDLILCNGPGTCIPICAIAFLLKCAFICDTRIVFVESFCRTKTFSLTGKLLHFIADNIIVQWPELKRRLKRAEYLGQLM